MGFLRERLGSLEAAVEQRLEQLEADRIPSRIWDRDPSVWCSDPARHESVQEHLGWLDLPARTGSLVRDLDDFAAEVDEQGFRQVVVLGTGASAMGAAVFRSVFEDAEGMPLSVLDSVDANAIRAVEADALLPKTLFVIASRSGNALETRALSEHFFARGAWGGQFAAITDHESPLAALAREKTFARIFDDETDACGAYTVLGPHGVVPAVLAGVDVAKLLRRARDFAASISSTTEAAANPALRLAAVLTEAVRAGRDKLTLVASPRLRASLAWLEQLVAESTGKEGTGLIPIVGEELADPGRADGDRLLVHIRDLESADEQLESQLEVLASQGQPVMHVDLQDRYDLGAMFLLWQVGTSIAAACLGVNPFDRSEMVLGRDETLELLSAAERTGQIAEEGLLLTEGPLRVYADSRLRPLVDAKLTDLLAAHFERLEPGDFIGLIVFAHEQPIGESLHDLRELLAKRFECPATLAIGPRCIHSTSQLFKSGPNKGVFLELVHTGVDELEIPHRGYGFEVLKEAQALGDFKALDQRERRVMRIHIGGDMPDGIERIRKGLNGD